MSHIAHPAMQGGIPLVGNMLNIKQVKAKSGLMNLKSQNHVGFIMPNGTTDMGASDSPSNERSSVDNSR